MALNPKPQAKAWDLDAARRRAAAIVPAGLADRLGPLRALLGQWAVAEVAPGRLVPWIAVAFGFGIVGYFTADREPAVWATLLAAATTIAVAYASRMRPAGFPVAIGVAAIATGFAVATLQTARIAHPVLQTTIASATLSGFVEIREERERSDRIVVRVHRFSATQRIAEIPERVRVAVRKGTAPAQAPGFAGKYLESGKAVF